MARPTRIVNVGDTPVTVEYATEAEVLDFANRIREAGGADVLDALLPSKPGNAHHCLIANALNFGCRVVPGIRIHDHAACWTAQYEWFMALPGHLDAARRNMVAEVIGAVPDYMEGTGEWHIRLPQHIGNAADAFDDRAGWTAQYTVEGY